MLETVYVLAVLAFCLAFYFLKIIPACVRLFNSSLSAIEVIANHYIDDHDKQKQVQTLGLNMLLQFVFLLLRVAILTISVALPFFVADYFSLVSLDDSMNYAMRVDVLLLSTLVVMFLIFIWRKLIPEKTIEGQEALQSDETAYSPIERAMHNIAFGSRQLQRTMNKLETRLYSSKWAKANNSQPVFVTSLARAGTTALLEALNTFPDLASHTYRDMPFIFSPVLWSKLSSSFQKSSNKKERAHGDGLMVNEESPEAFEEVIWHRFFPQKYTDSRIFLWKKSDEGFKTFFKDYMQRIIFLRHPDRIVSARYLSKNNANIARIPALQEMFPEAFIIVPVRDPCEHAISLFRQHQNFSEKHQGTSFTRKYMADIGHFEFGDLHKLIDFPEIEQKLGHLNSDHSDYWLAYWLACYQYLNALPEKGLCFVSYAELCADGETCLGRLCKRIGLDVSKQQIHEAASHLKAAPGRKQYYHFDEKLEQQAEKVYQELMQKLI